MQTSQTNLYEHDFYAWSLDMAAKIRNKQFDVLDIENVAEEIEGLARSDYRELLSRLEVLIGHLLKWQFQPEERSNSWRGTIREQRRRIKILLKDSPSLKPRFQSEVITKDLYQAAKNVFLDDTELSANLLPINNPYSPEQLLDDEFYPENNANK